MDLLLILFGLYLIYRSTRKSDTKTEDDRYASMTETQRRWHEMKNQKPNLSIEPQLTMMDLEEYIRSHMKPFSINGWLFDSINPRMKSYAYTMILSSYIVPIIVFAVLPIFFGIYIPVIYILISALIGDYLIYTVSRRYDVIFDDPEFRSKFSHLLKMDDV